MLDWLAELKEEDRSRAIREAFSKVASTEPGAIMISVLLEQLYFFRRAENDEQRALNNYAKFFLTLLGPDTQVRMVEAAIIASHENAKTRETGVDNGD